jgi:Kdo2-lipid IVA lauroyltransferase/acyltransferase
LKTLNIIFGYILVYPFLWLLSLLPLELLFRISDFIYFIIYKVLGYRVSVVRNNLKNSFPEKPEKELLRIERLFYQFLCDLFIETIKGITLSKVEAEKRYAVAENAKQIITKYLNAQQPIILTLGHYGMWELGGAIFGASTGMYVNVIYRPLSSAFTEHLMKTIRGKYGNRLIPMNETFKVMLQDKKETSVRATAFAIDQAAPPESAYWTTFLNQESSVFLGAEKLAVKFNYPVVHVYCTRIRRGYYEIDTTALCEQPKLLKTGELTEIITRDIERIILNDPSIWLWSHKRWKHKREDRIINNRLPSNLE